MYINKTFERIIVNEIDTRFPAKKVGKPRIFSTNYVVDRIIKVLRTGMQWSELEVNCGKPKTIYNLFNKYINDGIFERCYKKVLNLYYNRRGKISFFHATDTSFVKNIFGIDLLGRNPTDRGRNASKLSVIVDDNGVVFSLDFHEANKNDCTLLGNVLDKFIIKTKTKKVKFYADKAYDTKNCREQIEKYRYKNCVSRKGFNESHKEKYRYIVEHSFSWLDLYRRLIVRYEKKIKTYREFTFLALFIITSRKILKYF